MMYAFAILSAFLPVSIFALAPSTLTILNTNTTNCDVPVTAKVSRNNSAVDILYDTKTRTPDTLASTDSESDLETTCVVCTTLKWSDNVLGRIMSLDYDFENRLDPGLLEQIFTTITVPEKPEIDKAYFETSYIYGGEDTAKTYHVHTSLPNATEAILLDYKNESETICSQTTFRVFARGGVSGASGEIARKSVFTQSVNVVWGAQGS